jgi:hypothetical protein
LYLISLAFERAIILAFLKNKEEDMYWKIFGSGMALIYALQIVSLLVGIGNSFTLKKKGLERTTGKVIWLDFYMGVGFILVMAGVGIALLVK